MLPPIAVFVLLHDTRMLQNAVQHTVRHFSSSFSIVTFFIFFSAPERFRVFRSQLPQKNTVLFTKKKRIVFQISPLKPHISPLSLFTSQIYSGDEDGVLLPGATPPIQCVVCGLAGGKRCAGCSQATYCTKQHQTWHWRNGHKKACTQKNAGKSREGDRERGNFF